MEKQKQNWVCREALGQPQVFRKPFAAPRQPLCSEPCGMQIGMQITDYHFLKIKIIYLLTGFDCWILDPCWKNDPFHLLSPEMGITERGSPGSPRGAREAAAPCEQAALCELPPLWHLFLRHYFWKADFSLSQPLTHWPSLPGSGSLRLQLHFSADTSVDFAPPPLPIPMARISAWGCSRFYQCLKCFPARALGGSEPQPRERVPPWKLL